MDNKSTSLDKLPVPQSRSEQFLDNLCRNSDVNTLPDPCSRIEIFLDYLCRNGRPGTGASNAFNNLSQEVNKIDFKNGNNTIKSLAIISESEIDDIVNNLR